MSQAMESYEREVTDADGKVSTVTEQRPAAVCIRFVMHMIE